MVQSTGTAVVEQHQESKARATNQAPIKKNILQQTVVHYCIVPILFFESVVFFFLSRCHHIIPNEWLAGYVKWFLLLYILTKCACKWWGTKSTILFLCKKWILHTPERDFSCPNYSFQIDIYQSYSILSKIFPLTILPLQLNINILSREKLIGNFMVKRL